MICSINGCGETLHAKSWCGRHYMRWKRHGDPLAGGTSYGTPAAWIEEYRNFNSPACLLWPLGRAGGYGYINIDGTKISVSRTMCEHRHGPPPTPKHESAHSCGKGHLGCVNPTHLDWKNHQANMADCLEHGTHNRGERHGKVKLTSAAVLAIRASPGASQTVLGLQYGVAPATIWNIRCRNSWAWL